MTSAVPPFDPAGFEAFRFDSFEVDEASGVVAFTYRLCASGSDAADVEFVERVAFELPADAASVDWASLSRLLALLGSVLGLSYYKAAAPPRFEVAVEGLSEAGRLFLVDAIRHGLGEFAYRAGLPGLLSPELVIVPGVGAEVQPRDFDPEVYARPLAPIGGGKDSVVTVESLLAAGFEVTQFSVNPNAIMRRVAEAAGRPFVTAKRTIDPALLALNSAGALNGHVPVTAMNSLIAVTQSRLLGLGPVVMSNEASAAEATLEWNGESVNHQWSKSLDAELLLAAAIQSATGLRGGYFSLLRPFTELRIAAKFASTSRYDQAIVSCNRAFRINGAEPGWCGECAKCQFVFLAFSPFMSRERLVGIVGTDMFENAQLLAGFRSLLGIDHHKPFECVGEEAESTVAMSRAVRSPEWSASVIAAAMVAGAPELAIGDDALEAELFRDRPAARLTDDYERARHALG